MVEAVFLRDHHSGEKTRIDVGVIDFLADVLDAVGEIKATIQAVLPRVGPLGHVSGRCGSRRVDIVVSGTERG